MKKILLVLFLLLLTVPHGAAEDVSAPERVASAAGIANRQALFDMDMASPQSVPGGACLTLSAGEGIAGLYLVFDAPYGSVTLTEDERSVTVDTGGILHFYLDAEQALGRLPRGVELTFSSGGAALNELRIFTPGELPDWVQRWGTIEPGGAELLLLSAHGDDEQLFFAGLLPWYAAEQGKRVQVVYFTDHRNMVSYRVHEMLDGLWAVGVRDYPVFGGFPDYYTFDMEDAFEFYEDEGYPRQALLGFVVESLRYYRPLVAVGHDENGEYGHGMHRLTAELLKQAAVCSGDGSRFPASAEAYGAYQVPKTYLHLYPENPITMNWDIPMASFGGKTAYQVTRDLGFAAHRSQQADFGWYFRDAPRASEVERYSPCQYGLYLSTVGEDTGRGDFFENLEPELPPEGTEETQAPPAPSAPEPPPDAPASRSAAPAPAETGWPAIPAAGALTLTILTACFAASRRKEKN